MAKKFQRKSNFLELMSSLIFLNLLENKLNSEEFKYGHAMVESESESEIELKSLIPSPVFSPVTSETVTHTDGRNAIHESMGRGQQELHI